MAYQALYRKYRPTAFSDVVGQEHIIKTLTNELSEGKIFHAYLFTGTRGTGKTTCAKILAKAVNCLDLQNGNPCCKCDMCKAIANGEITDICEIDAASNSGVDNIRDIRERVNFAPVSSKYRVYIIDEVHMLSDGAFNALLKTIEEPPEHVIFILATTEVYKLPATILSRCQRFDFHRIDIETISKHIKSIADKENFGITEGAANLIASAADGGMRDALSILDLCLAGSDGEITEATVISVCGMAKQEYLYDLAKHIKNSDCQSAITLIDDLYAKSVDMRYLLSELINHYRNLMIVKTVTGKDKPIICSPDYLKSLEIQAKDYNLSEILDVLKALQLAKSDLLSGDKRLAMEMTLIRLCVPSVSSDISGIEKRLTALENAFAGIPRKAEKQTKKPKEDLNAENEDSIPMPTSEFDAVPSSDGINDETLPVNEDTSESNAEGGLKEWSDILSIIASGNPILHSSLIGSKAYLIDNRLLIDTNDPLFKQLYDMKTNREFIKSAIEKVLGKSYPLGPYHKAPEETDPLKALANRLEELKTQGGI